MDITDKDIARFWSHVDKSGECWIWTAARNWSGYGILGIKRKPLKENFLAHRFAYQITYGSIPDGLFVCHHCDNPACVRPEHLFLGTCADNAHDMVTKGRSCRGNRHRSRTHPESVKYGEQANYVKLTQEQVDAIRASRGITQRALAKMYGIAQPTVFQIIHFKTWKP